MLDERFFAELRSEEEFLFGSGAAPRSADPDGDDGGDDGGTGGSDDDWDPDSPYPIPVPDDKTSESGPAGARLEGGQTLVASGTSSQAGDPDDDDGGDDGGDSGGTGGSDDDWDPDSPFPFPTPDDKTTERTPDLAPLDSAKLVLEDGNASRANDPDGDSGGDGDGGTGGSDDDWDPDSPLPIPWPPEDLTSEGTPDYIRDGADHFIFGAGTRSRDESHLDQCWDDRPIRDDGDTGEPGTHPGHDDSEPTPLPDHAEFELIIM